MNCIRISFWFIILSIQQKGIGAPLPNTCTYYFSSVRKNTSV